MSRNSHVTLLTNLGQFREPSHRSHLHAKVPYWNSSSPKHAYPCISDIHLFRSQSVLLFYILVSVPNYCPLLSHYCFLVQIIVLTISFKNTSMFLVVSNCILVLVVFLTPIV